MPIYAHGSVATTDNIIERITDWSTFNLAWRDWVNHLTHDFYPIYQVKPLYAAEIYPFQRQIEYRRSAVPMCLLSIYENERNPAMASKRRNNNFSMPEMVNHKLNSEEKKGFEKWQKDNVESWHMELGDIISEDWRCGISFDAGNGVFIASFTQRGENHDWANYCITSRHPEYQVALMVNVFKLRVLYRGKKPEAIVQGDDWG